MIVLGIETSCDETAAAIVGPNGVASDIIHHFAVLWLIEGSPEFDLFYPDG